MGKILIAAGAVALIVSLLVFLAASVALNHVQDAGIAAPPGTTLRLPDVDPEVQRRQQQAETVVWGSLLTGLAGVVLLVVGLLKKSRNHDRGAVRQ